MNAAVRSWALAALLPSAVVWLQAPSGAWAATPAKAAAGQAPLKSPGKPTSSAAIPAALVPRGDPVAGRDKAEAERCLECHGVDGQGHGQPNGKPARFAKLAGQLPAYLLKQLADYRSGARKNDEMALVAKVVPEEDWPDIVAYFASLPAMKPEGSVRSESAWQLYLKGDPSRQVVACATCHGDRAQGVAPNIGPALAGQEPQYLEKQLLEWRAGVRRDAGNGIMNQALRGLTDDEVKALAAHLSSLPDR